MKDPGVYVDGVKVKDICSSPWGIGIYTVEYEDGPESIYGFPPTDMDPNDFSPDYECCSDAEIATWRAAKEAWAVEDE